MGGLNAAGGGLTAESGVPAYKRHRLVLPPVDSSTGVVCTGLASAHRLSCVLLMATPT